MSLIFPIHHILTVYYIRLSACINCSFNSIDLTLSVCDEIFLTELRGESQSVRWEQWGKAWYELNRRFSEAFLKTHFSSHCSLYFHSQTPWLKPVITAWPVTKISERWISSPLSYWYRAISCFRGVYLTLPSPLSARQSLILELSDNPISISSEDNSTEFNSLELGGPTNNTDVTAGTSDSSESASSEASDSGEANQIRTPDCVNGTASCESEEYFLQGIGDDGHAAVDHLMVPDDDDRELSLRWWFRQLYVIHYELQHP